MRALLVFLAVGVSCTNNSAGTSFVPESDGGISGDVAQADSASPTSADAWATGETDARASAVDSRIANDSSADTPAADKAASTEDAAPDTSADERLPMTVSECVGLPCDPGDGRFSGDACLALARSNLLFCVGKSWVDKCPGCVCRGSVGDCYAPPFPDGFDCSSDVECLSHYCKNNVAMLGKCGQR